MVQNSSKLISPFESRSTSATIFSTIAILSSSWMGFDERPMPYWVRFICHHPEANVTKWHVVVLIPLIFEWIPWFPIGLYGWHPWIAKVASFSRCLTRHQDLPIKPLRLFKTLLPRRRPVTNMQFFSVLLPHPSSKIPMCTIEKFPSSSILGPRYCNSWG